MIVFVFSEIIPHRTKILSWSYSGIFMVVSTLTSHLRVEFLLKTESVYLRDAGVT